jgi:CDP-diacylglycerol--glycerol-3-phosphate 3-phosphatidyltransferase
MERSIIKTVLFYLAIQLTLISDTLLSREASFASVVRFLALTVAVHASLAAFLLRFKSEFYNISTQSQLKRINMANRITLLRISSLPTVAYILQHEEVFQIKFVLPALLIMVFLTDSFDGQIARRGKQITRMGQMLDSISDYCLLGVISIIYFSNQLLPPWFFGLVLFRLFLQAAGMLVFILLDKPLPMKSTWGGKITIAAIMTLYALEVFKLYLPASFLPAFTILEYAAGGLILLLSFEKIGIFLKQIKR